MNEFYDYLASLEPKTVTDSTQAERCRQAVLKKMRQEQPRVRRSLKIALLASAAALAVSICIPATVSAGKTHWRDRYDFTPVQPLETVQKDMEALTPIMHTEPQRCMAEGFTLTLTGYAADGLHGAAFFEVTVPDGFDWKYPYLLGRGTQYLNGEAEVSSGSLLVGITGLTPTARPNVYCCEALLDVQNETKNMHDFEAPPAREIVFSMIMLCDEYTDFNDSGAYLHGTQNPHCISFPANFRLDISANECSTVYANETFGNMRLTPFGVYLYSFGEREIARHYRDLPVRPQLTLADGTVITPENAIKVMKTDMTYDYSPEAREIMKSRGEDPESREWGGVYEMVFRNPVMPDEIAAITMP